MQLFGRLFSRFSDPDSAWFDVALIFSVALMVITGTACGDLRQQNVLYSSQLLLDAPVPSLLTALVDTVTSGLAGAVLAVASLLAGLRLYSDRRLTGIALITATYAIAVVGTTLARYETTPSANVATLAALITCAVMICGIPLVLMERAGAWCRVVNSDRFEGRRAVLQVWACTDLIRRLGWGAAANLFAAAMSVAQDQPAWVVSWSFVLWSVIVLSTVTVVNGVARLAEASSYSFSTVQE